jgi:hypothetical protein
MRFKEKVASWQRATKGREKSAALAVMPQLLMAGSALELLDAAMDTVGKPFSPMLETFGYKLNRKLNGGVGGTLDRIKADEMVASNLVGRASDRVADIAEDLARGVAKDTRRKLVDDPKRVQIFTQLVKTDDIIGSADKRSLMEAYDSMAKFAPTLSTNISAARSFLREAAQHDGGIDYMTIKGLGQAERAVTGGSIGD